MKKIKVHKVTLHIGVTAAAKSGIKGLRKGDGDNIIPNNILSST